ncbi:ABC transporter ATP-binding protein [Enterococcus asini ATCC 700915]|uniref:ABC transporter ATP-binding protein n=2 Tax=Enterococcus asini TaxID=57732 RepID=R2SJG8_9ENTE|nr:ATP-binding cassette domain-containing protein [Enterococcus asini]EOH88319.1 ABC transporter ATP-binding protein [Enterococcus asini ATCC 700915]EOT56116.1 ABC transporter ATP-binding protein [Enterococcus asini ATCC 700915]MDT2743174.1 ATP-binding cassette domain-containing protein [Enterococcus asini]OJG13286.1 ABC transporter ATP-binding protein [Enterococcus asini]
MSRLVMKQATKVVKNGLDEERVLLDNVDLTIQPGEFITVVGGNGAGKSTLFNTISGSLPLTRGKITINQTDVTRKSEEQRAKYIARVFQDPKMGTAPRMTIAENLLLAEKRGQHRGLRPRKLQERLPDYKELCAQIGNGLEQHLDTPCGNLSGGQRQALSLLMATLTTPELLLLDEHTAALDPKTSKNLMTLTNQLVTEQQLTCLMITHHMEDALQYGNRLILMKKGKIAKDLSQKEKEQLTLSDLLLFFESDL